MSDNPGDWTSERPSHRVSEADSRPDSIAQRVLRKMSGRVETDEMQIVSKVHPKAKRMPTAVAYDWAETYCPGCGANTSGVLPDIDGYVRCSGCYLERMWEDDKED